MKARYQWGLFVDWCAAVAVKPLPTSPILLAASLDENSAGDTVQLRHDLRDWAKEHSRVLDVLARRP